jgi:hypothetical protein
MYYIIKNKDISDFIDLNAEKDGILPFIDNSEFVKGFIKNSKLDEEAFEQLNNILRYRQSIYSFGQNILYDNEPKTNAPFLPIEKAFYQLTLSGAGKYATENRSRFVRNWNKASIKDDLVINNNFTWNRKKQIDENFFLIWEGTYSYTKNILLFSLNTFGYIDYYNNSKGVESKTQNRVKYYGLMAYPIIKARYREDIKTINEIDYIDFEEESIYLIYTAFLDNTKLDLMHFYKNSSFNDKNENRSILDKINIGSRGQLFNAIIFQDDMYIKTEYSVGSFDNSIAHTQIEYPNIIFRADNGISLEEIGNQNIIFPPLIPNNNYGGLGGNLIQNSFNIFEKCEPENGYISMSHIGLHDSAVRELEIDCEQTIEIIPDNISNLPDIIPNDPPPPPPITISQNNPNIYKLVVGQEAKIYVKIKDKKDELDLEESKLESLSIKDLKKFKVIELDNYRRVISFIPPFKSDNPEEPIKLKLKLRSCPREFYFSLVIDDNIKSVLINDQEYNIEDEDENGINRKIAFKKGDSFNITIKYNNDNYTILKYLLDFYLGDCKFTINPSNNSIQFITNFVMPDRNVLLFFKTEALYTLTVFKESNSPHIESIDGYTDEGPNNIFPIIRKYIWDELIDLEVIFRNVTGNDDNKYYIIDKNYLISQYTAINVTDRRIKDGFYTYNENNIDQHIWFYMPDHDLTLYIKEIDKKLGLTFTVDKNIDHRIQRLRLDYNCDGNTNNDPEPNGILRFDGNGSTPTIDVLPGSKVKVRVEYGSENTNNDNHETKEARFFYKLDSDWVIQQIPNIYNPTITEKRRPDDNPGVLAEPPLPSLSSVTYENSALVNEPRYGSQIIEFIMPETAITINLKTIDPRYTLNFVLDKDQINEFYTDTNMGKSENGTLGYEYGKRIEHVWYYDIFTKKSPDLLTGIPYKIDNIDKPVNIFVEFSDDERRIDEEHLRNILEIYQVQIFEPGTNFSAINPEIDLIIKSGNSNIDTDAIRNRIQHFYFNLEDNLIVTLRWIDRVPYYWLSIQPEKAQYYAEQSNTPGTFIENFTIRSLFNNNVRIYGNFISLTGININDDNYARKYRIIESSTVYIYVKFPNFFLSLDDVLLLSELPLITIIENGKFDSGYSDIPATINDRSYQLIKFDMPSRDIILNLKWVEKYYLLTIMPNQRQFFKDPVEKIRRLKSVTYNINNDINNPTTSTIAIYDFTDVNSKVEIYVNKDKDIELFIKFSDIYQHLDKQYINMQLPGADLNEAGEFDGITIPSNIDNNNKEYFQYLKFQIPYNNFILYLQWVERLFEFDIDINEKYVEAFQLTDTRKVIDDDIYTTGEAIDARLVRFPHYTYPRKQEDINNTGTVISNNIGFKARLLEISSFTFNDSYYKFDNEKDKRFFQIDTPDGQNIILNTDGITVEEGTCTFTFNMFKKNVKFFLNVILRDGAVLLQEYLGVTSSILLDIGKYIIFVKGADGAKGGEKQGRNGSGPSGGTKGYGAKLTVIIETQTTLYYSLGTKGTPGGDATNNSSAGGGGGGGGASLYLFSNEVTIVNEAGVETSGVLEIYCWGGSGGKGGKGNRTNDPGGGGAGGKGNQSDNTTGEYNGDGRSGGNGEGTNRGVGGPGGNGWQFDRNHDEHYIIYSSTQISDYSKLNDSGNGLIYIENLGEGEIDITRILHTILAYGTFSRDVSDTVASITFTGTGYGLGTGSASDTVSTTYTDASGFTGTITGTVSATVSNYSLSGPINHTFTNEVITGTITGTISGYVSGKLIDDPVNHCASGIITDQITGTISKNVSYNVTALDGFTASTTVIKNLTGTGTGTGYKVVGGVVFPKSISGPIQKNNVSITVSGPLTGTISSTISIPVSVTITETISGVINI